MEKPKAADILKKDNTVKSLHLIMHQCHKDVWGVEVQL